MAEKYPPISDYGLIADCQTARPGVQDWLDRLALLPRFDSGSSFGRMLDWQRGGFFSIDPVDSGAEPWTSKLPRWQPRASI